MLNLYEFEKLVKERDIINYSLDKIRLSNLSNVEQNILKSIGLPSRVHPCIYFINEDEGALDRLDKYYELSEEDYNIDDINKIKEYLHKHIVIGRTSGRAICINDKMQIVYIDNDDFEEYYINDSLEQFLECILCFNKFVKEINKRTDNDIYYYDHVTRDEVEKLKINIESIIKGSIESYYFWDLKIEFLMEHIKD